MATKTDSDENDKSGEEPADKKAVDKNPEPEVDGDEDEGGEDEGKDDGEEKPKAEKAKAKKPKADLEDPAVKKAMAKIAKEAEARGRKAAEDEAARKAADAKLSEDERRRKELDEANQKAAAAEKRAAEFETREALREAMDDADLKPAGTLARETIAKAIAAAREKDPSVEIADVVAALRKSDEYLFKSTKAGPVKAEKDDDGEEKPAKRSTEQRGGKTPTSHKPPAEDKDPNVIQIGEKDPRKIREHLKKAGIAVQ